MDDGLGLGSSVSVSVSRLDSWFCWLVGDKQKMIEEISV